MSRLVSPLPLALRSTTAPTTTTTTTASLLDAAVVPAMSTTSSRPFSPLNDNPSKCHMPKGADWTTGISGLKSIEETFACSIQIAIVGDREAWLKITPFAQAQTDPFKYPAPSDPHSASIATTATPKRADATSVLLNPSPSATIAHMNSFPVTPNPSPLKSNSPNPSRVHFKQPNTNMKLHSMFSPAAAAAINAINSMNSSNAVSLSSSSSSQSQSNSSSINNNTNNHSSNNNNPKAQVLLQDATTLLQNTITSSPHRRRRRGAALEAKTQNLTVALETLRQKRAQEQRGLMKLLETKEGALGSYGKELRKYVSGGGVGGVGGVGKILEGEDAIRDDMDLDMPSLTAASSFLSEEGGGRGADNHYHHEDDVDVPSAARESTDSHVASPFVKQAPPPPRLSKTATTASLQPLDSPPTPSKRKKPYRRARTAPAVDGDDLYDEDFGAPHKKKKQAGGSQYSAALHSQRHTKPMRVQGGDISGNEEGESGRSAPAVDLAGLLSSAAEMIRRQEEQKYHEGEEVDDDDDDVDEEEVMDRGWDAASASYSASLSSASVGSMMVVPVSLKKAESSGLDLLAMALGFD